MLGGEAMDKVQSVIDVISVEERNNVETSVRMYQREI